MQIRSGTWRDMTTRIFGQPLPFDRAFDPALNRRVGTAYLAFLQERIFSRKTEWKSDERSLLLAAYNAGPGRLFESGFNLAQMPDQTQDYVERASALHNTYLDDMAASVRQRLLAANASAAAGI
jgi:soluble lytic murein transglycosylase-like protein